MGSPSVHESYPYYILPGVTGSEQIGASSRSLQDACGEKYTTHSALRGVEPDLGSLGVLKTVWTCFCYGEMPALGKSSIFPPALTPLFPQELLSTSRDGHVKACMQTLHS